MALGERLWCFSRCIVILHRISNQLVRIPAKQAFCIMVKSSLARPHAARRLRVCRDCLYRVSYISPRNRLSPPRKPRRRRRRRAICQYPSFRRRSPTTKPATSAAFLNSTCDYLRTTASVTGRLPITLPLETDRIGRSGARASSIKPFCDACHGLLPCLSLGSIHAVNAFLTERYVVNQSIASFISLCAGACPPFTHCP